MDIKGKVVIVTGASSGIGEATARQFGREGAKLVLAARRVDKLESLAQEILAMGSGAETFVVQADLSKLEDIHSLIKQTLDKFGRIDVLVNNAGFGRLDWLENLDPVKDIQAQFDVNVLGVIQTKPYPEEKGMQRTIDFLAPTNPHLKGQRVANFIDDSLLKEIEREGFFTRLYR